MFNFIHNCIFKRSESQTWSRSWLVHRIKNRLCLVVPFTNAKMRFIFATAFISPISWIYSTLKCHVLYYYEVLSCYFVLCFSECNMWSSMWLTIKLAFWNAVLWVLMLDSHAFDCMHSRNAFSFFLCGGCSDEARDCMLAVECFLHLLNNGDMHYWKSCHFQL